MDNLRSRLQSDIEQAATEKLAGKRKKKSLLKKYKLDEIATRGSQYAAGAVIASIIKDIQEKPVEFTKNKIYDLVHSAASRIVKL